MSVVVPFSGKMLTPKALLKVGGIATINVALAVLPVPPLVEVTLPVVLFLVPEVVPVTSTLMVHELFAGMLPPLRLMVPEPATAVTLPEQAPTTLAGVATTSPAGRLSVKATPVRASVRFGLVMVKVSVVEVLSPIAGWAKAFEIAGGATTVIDALAVLPVGNPAGVVAVTLPDVLFFTPAVVPVTFTEIVQLLPAGSEPPLRLMVPEPAVAKTVPSQSVVIVGIEATTKPAGSESVKAIPESATVVFGLVTVKVSVVVPLSGMVAAPKALLMVGGPTTVTVSEAVPPAPLSLVVMVPVVLFLTPMVVPVTLTLNEQFPAGSITPLVRLMVPEPAVAEMVPLPHPPVMFGTVATTSPAGRVSVNETPVSPSVALELVMLKVNVVVPLSGKMLVPNDLVKPGGAATESVSLAVPPVPPSFEVTLLVVLTFTPAVVARSVTEIEQVPPGVAIAPPLKVNVVAPAVGFQVPPQVLLAPGVV